MNFQHIIISAIFVLLIANNQVFASDKSLSNIKTLEHVIENRSQKNSYISVKLHSAILEEDRELLISLPENYEKTDKQYPILYLLDGNRHFTHAINAVNVLQQESMIPPSIIVAITNNNGTRSRDLGQQKAKFLAFIEQEVMTLVTKRYRTLNINTLFGHSMAGAFALDVMISKPMLFDHYIAASPVIQINNSDLLNKFSKIKANAPQLNKPLYISFGHHAAEGKEATQAWLVFNEEYTGLSSLWKSQEMQEQIHMTTPYLTLYSGLTHAFSDYQIPRFSGLDEFSTIGSLKGFTQYFKQRAKKYNEADAIPEPAFRNLGFALFDEGYQVKGIEILKQSVKHHPDSFRAINALAQVYEDAGQKENALITYQKGLTLAAQKSSTNSGYFQRQIKRLNEAEKEKN